MAFMFRLELEDGTPAEPPTLNSAVPDWHVDDTIPLGAGRTLRVVELRDGATVEDAPVLVVVDAAKNTLRGTIRSEFRHEGSSRRTSLSVSSACLLLP